MPVSRVSQMMAIKGLNLMTPPDRMEPGYFPYLHNIRPIQTGATAARHGLTGVSASPGGAIHSLRHMLDSNGDTQLFAGSGTSLYRLGTYSAIDTGFSGEPLSMVPWRPEQSPLPYMYVGDSNKLRKYTEAGVVKNVGVAPPAVPPSAELGVPYHNLIAQLDVITGWVGSGTAGTLNSYQRAGANIINHIMYDVGSTGWCIINTAATDLQWLGEGARYNLTTEYVVAQEVHPPFTATTIASSMAEPGSTDIYSVVLANYPPTLRRNAMLYINSAFIARVLSVHDDIGGGKSIRIYAASAPSTGQSVVGLHTIRAYTTQTHVDTEAIPIQYYLNSTIGKGTAIATKTVTLDLSKLNGRELSRDDWMHISIGMSDDPSLLAEGKLMLDVDSATNDFTHNYYYKSFGPDAYFQNASGTKTVAEAGQSAELTAAYNAGPVQSIILENTTGWCELSFRIGDLVRVGSDTNRTLAHVKALRLEWTVTASTTIWAGSWYVSGGYSPDVPPGTLEGRRYRLRYRDSSTGARSMPGPTSRHGLYPLRTSVNVGYTASTDASVDVIDLEIWDPNLQGGSRPEWVHLATVANATSTYVDNSRSDLIAGNQPLETWVWQPFVTLAPPISGLCTVSGTSVTLTSGAVPLDLMPGTIIQLSVSGQTTAHQIYGPPVSTTLLNIEKAAGFGMAVPFTIAAPNRIGQPLPFIFGPGGGAGGQFVFGLGDPDNPGNLYWMNGNDPDSTRSSNFIEITSHSEPLIAGICQGAYTYVFTHNRIFAVRRAADFADSSQAAAASFTFYEIPTPSGLWGRWALCRCAQGVAFLGRDGIYLLAGDQVECISSNGIAPLFPHTGVQYPTMTDDYYPVDMAAYDHLRVSSEGPDIYFDYVDTAGAYRTLHWIGALQGWFPYTYAFPVAFRYLEDSPDGTTARMLVATTTGALLMASSATDDCGTPFICSMRTPILNAGETRALKLFSELSIDSDGPATYTLRYNRAAIIGPTYTIGTTSRVMLNQPLISRTSLPLYVDICADVTFSPGAYIYEFQVAFYPYPCLTSRIVVRTDHGFPGWVLARDSYWTLISNTPVDVRVIIDGVAHGPAGYGDPVPYTLPSTAGALTKIYQRLSHGSKGHIWLWELSSPTEFLLLPEECTVRMKSWTGNLIDIRPVV